MTPRLLRSARWVCTILALTTAAAWAASARYCAVWRAEGNDSITFILKGRIEIYHTGIVTSDRAAYSPGLSAGRTSKLWMWDQHWQWTPFFRLFNAHTLTLHAIIPLWCPFLLSALPATLLWHAHIRSRRRAGHCPACGYDRRGLALGNPCPECGSPPDQTHPAAMLPQ